MKNRRGFNPDARVKDAAFAFRVLSDSVFTKGFLGPSLRENNGLPSVGVSAARRAGVNIGDDGKMRCPPGTPNANQFTDINMSNCMVPSAETVARNAAEVAVKLASRTADGFKRGAHTEKKKDRNVVPSAGVGFADEDGFLSQRRIMRGAQVSSPLDGSQRTLSTPEDSILHIREGGSLSDIPDEHLLQSISNNPERFTLIGQGGGIHGMDRFRDEKTGALLGVKYPTGEDSKGIVGEEPFNEVVSELFAEHMGYEPVPMRLTLSNRGFGISLVTELVHNRNSGSIESGRLADRDGKYNYDIDPASLIRMNMLDIILRNEDRHEGNYLISNNDGERTVLPIDHSLSLFSDRESSSLDDMVHVSIWGHGFDEVMSQFADDEGHERLVSIVAQLQEDLRAIDIEQLRGQLRGVQSHVGFFGGMNREATDKKIDSAISRLKVLRESSASDLAEIINPQMNRDYRRRAFDPNRTALTQDVIDAFDAIFDEPTEQKPSVV